MPIRFRCPECQKQITVRDELAGKMGACPSCKAALRAPGRREDDDQENVRSKPPSRRTANAPGPTAAEPESRKDPLSLAAQRDAVVQQEGTMQDIKPERERWKKVSVSLMFKSISIYLIGSAVALFLLIFLYEFVTADSAPSSSSSDYSYSSSPRRRGPSGFQSLLLSLCMGLLVLNWIFALVAHSMGTSVPRSSYGKPLSVVCIVLAALSVLAGVIIGGMVIAEGGRFSSREMRNLTMVANVLFVLEVARFSVHAFYVKSIGQALDDEETAKSAGRLAIFYPVVNLVTLALIVLLTDAMVTSATDAGFVVLFAVIRLAILLGMLFWYLMLIRSTHGLVLSSS